MRKFPHKLWNFSRTANNILVDWTPGKLLYGTLCCWAARSVCVSNCGDWVRFVAFGAAVRGATIVFVPSQICEAATEIIMRVLCAGKIKLRSERFVIIDCHVELVRFPFHRNTEAPQPKCGETTRQGNQQQQKKYSTKILLKLITYNFRGSERKFHNLMTFCGKRQ